MQILWKKFKKKKKKKSKKNRKKMQKKRKKNRETTLKVARIFDIFSFSINFCIKSSAMEFMYMPVVRTSRVRLKRFVNIMVFVAFRENAN